MFHKSRGNKAGEDVASRTESCDGDVREHGVQLSDSDAGKSSLNENQKGDYSDDPLSQGMKDVKAFIGGADRDHVWAFTAGERSQDFRGNPKYLFLYVCKYRPDIRAYWLCTTEDTIQLVKSLGFHAYHEEEPAAQYLINRTGVLVAEQVKAVIPEGLCDIKYINLWHGIGFKKVERSLLDGQLAMEIARKYVHLSDFYRTNQMLLVSCPEVERELHADTGVEYENLIRAGYPRNLYQQNYEPVVTFDHDIRKIKGLSQSAKIVVYAPTYRALKGDVFAEAMPDLKRLYEFCETKDWLFIFKVHPKMESEEAFVMARATFGNRPHFWFWDNKDDFYEIMHMTDLAIYDYSSIFTDLAAMGVRHFIRYVYDYDSYMATVDTYDAYLERTAGRMAYSWDDLFAAMEQYDSWDDRKEIKEIHDRLWSYSHGREDFDHIVEAVLNFQPRKLQRKTLISFDVFDTLISRKTLEPEGIFYAVRDEIEKHAETFPGMLVRHYPEIRKEAEANVREFKRKSAEGRESGRVEVTLDEIICRIRQIYDLDDRQTEELLQWEIDAELANVIPLPEYIELLKRFRKNPDNEVILISDMYLPIDVVQRMLVKADPELEGIPLYLSNEYGVLKTSQRLFLEVYKSYQPFYDFRKWIHYGDNIAADQNSARSFKIYTRRVTKPLFNRAQRSLVQYCDSYDSFRVAALQARLCHEHPGGKENLTISVIALCLVPYVDWVIRDAQKRGYKKLYFVMRDGYHLKRIADAILSVRKETEITTHLLYASRRTWQTPSYIETIDPEFWDLYCGAFDNIPNEEKLYSAMYLSREKFQEFFPAVDLSDFEFTDRTRMKELVAVFKNSATYREYLLGYSREKRELSEAYILQEMNPEEAWAIVEYWGRGYTQECFGRLYSDAFCKDPGEAKIPFYYCRSISPTEGNCIRYNFTSNDTPQHWLEAIFANMPFKSVEGYEKVDNLVVPITNPCSYDAELFQAMKRLLPVFAAQYASEAIRDPETMDRLLCNVAFKFFKEHRQDENLAELIGPLTDSVALYGKKREFAPSFSMKDLDRLQNKDFGRGSMALTTSITMSYARSDAEVRLRYDEMYQIFPGDNPAGGTLLTEQEQKQNDKYRKKYKAALKTGMAFRTLYEAACSEYDAERGRTLLISEGGLSDYLRRSIETAFTDAGLCAPEIIRITKDSDQKKLAEELAGAEFIITLKSIPLFCNIKWRWPTRQILLNDSAFVLYNKGFAASYKLKWRNKYTNLIQSNDVSVLQIPGDGCRAIYESFYVRGGRDGCNDWGMHNRYLLRRPEI